MENKDLKFIKKFYGEDMMHMCREFFPTILDEEGKLAQIMKENFAPTKALYTELVNQEATDAFRFFISSLAEQKNSQLIVDESKTPMELFDEAGYILYPECQTEEDIQSFRKYYAPEEEICTFRARRLNTCRVWFAVKKNVDEIKRENFTNPQREDEYGTSVISIQFSRCGGWLSIKNRYNHTVRNPDSTFCNRLDNIAPTLDYRFREYFGLPLVNLDSDLKLELNNFVLADDNKYYHVNLQIDDFSFCENNVVISAGSVTQFDKDFDILIDNILVNKRKKTVEVLSALLDYDDNCLDGFNKHVNINEIKKEYGEKDIVITNEKGESITFTINKHNQIIGYINENITTLKNDFLRYNVHVKNVSLPNVKTIGNNFLSLARNVESIDFPKVEKIGDQCMQYCDGLKSLSLPNVTEIGDCFLDYSSQIENIELPNVQKIGNEFLMDNNKISSIDFPKLESCGFNFLGYNEKIKKVSLPNLEQCDANFLKSNINLSSINLPKLKYCGSNFLALNYKMKNVSLPNLEQCDANFLYNNTWLRTISLPKLKICGNNFICVNGDIKTVSLPNLKKCGSWFLQNNYLLSSIDLPNLQIAGKYFMENNNRIRRIYFPKLHSVDSNFMDYNESIRLAILPKLTQCGEFFFGFNPKLKVYAPNCKTDDTRFVDSIQDEENNINEHSV